MLIKPKLGLHIVLLLFSCRLISVSGQHCRTISTKGGTPKSEPCVFPFIYNKRRYISCTRDWDPQNRLWCSVEVDTTGQHVTKLGRWGHCGRSCFMTVPKITTKRPLVSTVRIPVSQTTKKTLLHRTTPIPSRLSGTAGSPNKFCVTVSGPSPNRTCIFPFTFDGIKYSKCIKEVNNPNLSWCSTKVDSFGWHVKGHWGHCFCTNKEGCADIQFQELNSASTDGTHLPRKKDPEFRCGVSRINKNVKFIIGGQAAKLQEFPFAVLLGYKIQKVLNGKLVFLCSGVLINRRYVLTAAHCIQNRPVNVRLGDYDITKDCDCINGTCAPTPQTIDVEDVKVHENYNTVTFANDIALIRMSQTAILNAGVGVVCMPDASLNRNLVNERATIMGWGRNIYFSNGELLEIGAPVPVIQKVEVPIVDYVTCRCQYPNRTIDQKIICAGKVGADSCKGDSGGPMVFQAKSGEPWTLIGIVSFGDVKCGSGKAGIYTDVRQYMDWIRANLRS